MSESKIIKTNKKNLLEISKKPMEIVILTFLLERVYVLKIGKIEKSTWPPITV